MAAVPNTILTDLGGKPEAQAQRPVTLGAVVDAAAEWDAEFSEVSLATGELFFEPHRVAHGGKTYVLDQSSRTALFDRIGAPGGYWAKHTPEFQARGLSEHAAIGDFGNSPKLVLRGDKVFTVIRGDLSDLAIRDVFRATQEGLGVEGESLFVARIGRSGSRIDVDLVSPSKAMAVRRGDVVQSGLHIVHERFGTTATVIEAFVYRLVCANGLTRRECGGTGRHARRTRKLPSKLPNSRELQMQQVRRLTCQTWAGLQAQLEELRSISERPAQVRELLVRWMQLARISPRTMLDRLLAAWREDGAENTYWGAVNALTWVATHGRELTERQRRTLSSLAGLLAFSSLHLCPRCFAVLGNGMAGADETERVAEISNSPSGHF